MYAYTVTDAYCDWIVKACANPGQDRLVAHALHECTSALQPLVHADTMVPVL
jgi:hypothetical protein